MYALFSFVCFFLNVLSIIINVCLCHIFIFLFSSCVTNPERMLFFSWVSLYDANEWINSKQNGLCVYYLLNSFGRRYNYKKQKKMFTFFFFFEMVFNCSSHLPSRDTQNYKLSWNWFWWKGKHNKRWRRWVHIIWPKLKMMDFMRNKWQQINYKIKTKKKRTKAYRWIHLSHGSFPVALVAYWVILLNLK